MRRTSLFLLFLVVTTSIARGDVKLPNVFGDHMVLQRGQKIPVWGKADPGEKVTVKIESQSQSAVADQSGNRTFECLEDLPPSSSPVHRFQFGADNVAAGVVCIM